jgi:hypothetical protein
VCHCYDDVKKPEKATAFIAHSLAEIKDLQTLEALDPVGGCTSRECHS